MDKTKEEFWTPYNFVQLVGDKDEEKAVMELTAEEMDLILFALMCEQIQWRIAKERSAKEDKPHNGMISGAVQKAEAKEKRYKELYQKIADFMEIKR